LRHIYLLSADGLSGNFATVIEISAVSNQNLLPALQIQKPEKFDSHQIELYVRMNYKFGLGVLKSQRAETVFNCQMILQSHFQTLVIVLPVKHGVRVITEFYLFSITYLVNIRIFGLKRGYCETLSVCT